MNCRLLFLSCVVSGLPLVGPAVLTFASAQEQALEKNPELTLRLTEHEEEEKGVKSPFEEKRVALIEKYGGALEGALVASTKAGNLDAALAIKEELKAAKAGLLPLVLVEQSMLQCCKGCGSKGGGCGFLA